MREQADPAARTSRRASTDTRPPPRLPDVREIPPDSFPTDTTRRRAKLLAALPAIRETITKIFEADRLVGLAVGIVLDGELVHSEGLGERHDVDGGPIDGRTAFRVGSITKLFTTLAALRLAEAGRLDLDAPASDLLPELTRLAHPGAGLRQLTVRDILTHTSGLPRNPDLPPLAVDRTTSRQDLLDALDGLSLARPPGLVSDYSNLGFSLLGHLVAAAAARPYHDEIRGALLDPLAMRDTVWERTDVPPERLAFGHTVADGRVSAQIPTRHGEIDAAGGLFSTVEDLARFLAFQLDAWPLRSAPERGPVTRATLRESHTLRAHQVFRARTTASSVEGRASGVGLAWRVTHGCDHPHVVGHNGAVDGYHATLRFFPHAGVGIIVLANAAWADTDHITDEIQRALDRADTLDPRAPRPLPELTAAATRLTAQLAAWDDAAFTEHATLALREPPALARLRERARWLHTALGPCTLGPLKRATSAWSGVYRLQCERGAAELSLALTTTPTPKLASVALAWIGGTPAAPVQQAAADALALLERPDDQKFRDLFSPTVTRTGFDRLAAAMRHEHGTCRLGPALEVPGPDAATFSLTCDRGAARLLVALDHGRPPRITAFQLTPHGPVPPCR